MKIYRTIKNCLYWRSQSIREYKSLKIICEKTARFKESCGDEFRKLNFMYQYSDETGDVINETLNLNERFKRCTQTASK